MLKLYVDIESVVFPEVQVRRTTFQMGFSYYLPTLQKNYITSKKSLKQDKCILIIIEACVS